MPGGKIKTKKDNQKKKKEERNKRKERKNKIIT